MRTNRSFGQRAQYAGRAELFGLVRRIRAATTVAAGAASRVRIWLSLRHSLRGEVAVVLALYGLYELARGLVVGEIDAADRHAHRVVALERSLHLFLEGHVQRAAHAVPGFTGLLGAAYLTLHLAVTAGILLWLHQRRAAAFPFVRTTLLLASGVALVGFLFYPTAPPRLAGIGIVDTVSSGHVDLNHGLVNSPYNPDAAVPSMHIGYAIVVGATLLRYTRSRLSRLVGALYPPFVLLVVVATGNHFFFDAAAGAMTVALAAGATLLVTRPSTPDRLARLPERPRTRFESEKRAA
jgi:PAP2 superfamily protein